MPTTKVCNRKAGYEFRYGRILCFVTRSTEAITVSRAFLNATPVIKDQFRAFISETAE
jgi:hypothetical protein